VKQKEAKANVEIDLQIKRCRSQMALSGKSVENNNLHMFLKPRVGPPQALMNIPGLLVLAAKVRGRRRLIFCLTN